MTDDIVVRAFEPFFTTKPRGQGTGLGLASVHGLAVRSGGRAHISSQPGRGTRVTLELPRIDDPVTPAATRAEAAVTAGGPCTILVAEDDAGTRRIVDRILQSAGYTVRLAADGVDALREIERDGAGIDLLLTDVMMPGMTGPELANRAREHLPHLPVLFMTGYTEAQVRADSSVALDGAVITKPFSGSELTARIAGALRTATTSAQL
jgi:CheY-like chemotaxis protein